MHFQIIWEFNCKSNKNMKSYHVLYENIVSDLFINKYSLWFHLIRREVLSWPSAHVTWSFTEWWVARSLSATPVYWVCLQIVSATYKTQELRESLQKYISCSRDVYEGSGFCFPVGLQGTSHCSVIAWLTAEKRGMGFISLHALWVLEDLLHSPVVMSYGSQCARVFRCVPKSAVYITVENNLVLPAVLKGQKS